MKYQFYVSVETDTLANAELVIAERLGHEDKDSEVEDYTLDWHLSDILPHSD